MEKWRGVALNDLMRTLKSGTWVFLPVIKERAEKRGINISYGGIAEFLANKHVENYVSLKLKEKKNE